MKVVLVCSDPADCLRSPLAARPASLADGLVTMLRSAGHDVELVTLPPWGRSGPPAAAGDGLVSAAVGARMNVPSKPRVHAPSSTKRLGGSSLKRVDGAKPCLRLRIRLSPVQLSGKDGNRRLNSASPQIQL